MKWLKRKIQQWVWDLDDEPREIGRDNRILETNYIRIDIYRGDGGLAVETLVYNKKKAANPATTISAWNAAIADGQVEVGFRFRHVIDQI